MGDSAIENTEFSSNLELLEHLTQKLKQDEELSHAILNAIVDGVVIIDEYSKIVYVNDVLCRDFMYSKEELINKNVSILVSNKHNKEHGSYVERYVKTLQDEHNILGVRRKAMAKRKDGSEFPIFLAVNSFTMFDKLYFLAVVIDIEKLGV